MGSAYKKNMKNLLGKQDITGTDVLTVGTGVVLGAIAATLLPDPYGVSVFTMPRAARLEGLVANLNGTALTGAERVGIELWAGGAVVGSGTLTATDPSVVSIILDKENGNEVKLATGDTVFVNHAADLVLSSAQTLSVRVHLAMLEL